MNPNRNNCVFILVVFTVLISCSQSASEEINTNEVSHQKSRNILNESEWSPGAQIMARIAKEIISRSTGNSQVLSLNLTNLLILLVLKALVFAAGMIGVGSWQSHYARNKARAEKSSSYLSPGEVSLILSFLDSEETGHPGCVLQAACKSPEEATRYLGGARLMIQGAKSLESIMDYNPRYELLVQQLDGAVHIGNSQHNCQHYFPCYK